MNSQFTSKPSNLDHIVITPHKVFSEIMVLASPPAVDPDKVNALTQQIFD